LISENAIQTSGTSSHASLITSAQGITLKSISNALHPFLILSCTANWFDTDLSGDSSWALNRRLMYPDCVMGFRMANRSGWNNKIGWHLHSVGTRNIQQSGQNNAN
jgi:hypothetical protein